MDVRGPASQLRRRPRQPLLPPLRSPGRGVSGAGCVKELSGSQPRLFQGGQPQEANFKTNAPGIEKLCLLAQDQEIKIFWGRGRVTPPSVVSESPMEVMTARQPVPLSPKCPGPPKKFCTVVCKTFPICLSFVFKWGIGGGYSCPFDQTRIFLCLCCVCFS